MNGTVDAALPESFPVDADVMLRRHQNELRAFCSRYRADPHERDELVQLSMIRAWRGIGGFEGRSSFTTWLHQIVRNTAASEHQRAMRRPVPTDGSLHQPAPVPPPEDVIVARDLLDRALGGLPADFRRAVELVDVWGCPAPEAARLAGTAEATVRSRRCRAHRQLRTALGPSLTSSRTPTLECRRPNLS